jgi:hypothetical protein
MKTFLQNRIERYVDAMPEAVAGQGGHVATFKVAVALVRGFHLRIDEALPFLQRYNQRCAPPWSERELKHKLASADKCGRQASGTLKPRGYLL